MAVVAFEYPPGVHVRRHGPFGYDNYVSYREWLRDEFCFRCVFCLKRELWDIRLGSFHIDHFIPQSVAPDLGCVYDNLVYVCARCNSVKSDLDVPDPCKISFAESMKVVESGTVEALDESGEILVEVLNLNERDRVRYRKLLIDTLSSLAPEKEEEILCQWLGFPDDLPNLSNRQAANSRPDGINQSYYEKRSRGELPPRY